MCPSWPQEGSFPGLLEDHQHTELLIADEAVLGARRNEDGIAFAKFDLLSLDLERAAPVEDDVDLVVLVRGLAVWLRRHEHVDAVACGQPILRAGDVERLGTSQGPWLTLWQVYDGLLSIGFAPLPWKLVLLWGCERGEVGLNRKALIGSRAEDRAGPLREEGGEVAPDDLSRRPPQRLAAAEERIRATGQLSAGEERCSAGQDEPAQDRTERLRLDLHARQRGDLLCGRVGLLGGEAALLDRKRRRVAGGEDVRQVAYVSAWIGRDESLRIGWHPADRRALEPGQGDDAVGFDVPLGRERENPILERDGVPACE